LVVLAAALVPVTDAHALLGSLVKTTTTTVNTATSTTKTALEPVTQVTSPIVADTKTAVTSTDTSIVSSTTTAIAPVLDPLNPVPPGYDPLPALVEFLGDGGWPSTVSAIACPPAGEVSETLALTGAGAIGDGLTTLACIGHTLEYRFYTRFREANGNVIGRGHVATLGIPRALNVDNDVEPDLLGTITLTGLNSVGLVVERHPLQVDPLPVAVEAVLNDPTGGSLGRDHIAFGFDARDDAAPQQFALSTPIDTVLQPAPEFSIDLAQRAPAARIAVIGSIFDGRVPPAERVDPAEVRLAYGRSPAAASIRAAVGDDRTLVELGTPSRGPAEISGRIVEGADQQRFRAEITDLPTTLGITASQAGAGTEASLTASEPVARIAGELERRTGDLIADKTVLELKEVPLGVELALDGDQGTVTTTGGPIGHTRVGTANGEPVFLVDQNAYLNVHRAGPLVSVAAASFLSYWVTRMHSLFHSVT
jgi:hypothetical protein